jgi:hypothetical protein
MGRLGSGGPQVEISQAEGRRPLKPGQTLGLVEARPASLPEEAGAPKKVDGRCQRWMQAPSRGRMCESAGL